MAQTTQVPQYVSALLGHLASRPGVQSTLILSRKDGSIIQSTGLLASSKNHHSSPRANDVIESSLPPSLAERASSPTPRDTPPTNPTSPQPYKPSHAEALAAHIHAFVLSASALSISLSHPPSTTAVEDASEARSSNGNGVEPTVGHSSFLQGDLDGEYNHERGEEEDEIKLLRLRTRKHEIVVVPDRKYLLCVVHDTASTPGSTGR